MISADATNIQVIVRFEQAGVDAVDRVRGDVPRAAWIRRLCEQAVAAHDALALDEAQAGPATDGPREVSAPVGVPEPHRASAVVPVVPPAEQSWTERAAASRDQQIAAADAYSRAHGRSA